MQTNDKSQSGSIVRARAGAGALAVRSATLVARGLRDLNRESNWIRQQVFRGKASKIAVSSTGAVSAISAESGSSYPRVIVYDVHNSEAKLALAVPDEVPALAKHLPAAFAWSPSGRFLAGAWAAWSLSVHLFDFQSKEFVGSFGKFQQPPAHFAWSPDERLLVAASAGGKLASLQLWQLVRDDEGNVEVASDLPAVHAGVPDWLERQTYEAEFGEEGAFGGYGQTAFSPDGKSLASVVEIHGEWADDSIVFTAVPSLRRAKSFQAQGHVTGLTWVGDGGSIVFCASGQAYRLDRETLRCEQLPFNAEMCVAHPRLPLVLCFSSWVKESAKGKLFVADLSTGKSFDVCGAENIAEMRWSENGQSACAISKDGVAHIYEPPAI